MSTLGDKLYAAKLITRLMHKQLAFRLDLSQAGLSNIIQGKVAHPYHWRKIEEYLKEVNVNWQALELASTELVEPFEGFVAQPYQDPGGVWSIGFGSTRGLKNAPITAKTPPVTRTQALALVQRDLASAATCLHNCVTVPLNVNQEAALLDFIYNLGEGNFESSTLLRMLNAGDYTAAGLQFTRWDHDNGVVLPGLLRRRQAEEALFMKELET